MTTSPRLRRKFLAVAVAGLLSLSLHAQQPPAGAGAAPANADTIFISAGDIAGRITKARATGKAQGNPLLSAGPVRGNLEFHSGTDHDVGQNRFDAELFVVLQGSGTLTLGSTLIDPAQNGPHSQSSRAEGGVPYQLSQGDVVLVPANVAHTFSDVPGPLALLSLHVPLAEAVLLPGDARPPDADTMLQLPRQPGSAPPPPPPAPSGAPAIPFALALEAAQVTIATCEATGAHIAVAVTDSTGEIEVMLAAQGAASGRSFVAARKALTAAVFRAPTSVVQSLLRNGDAMTRSRLQSNMVFFPGGVPAMAGDRVVGAVGRVAQLPCRMKNVPRRAPQRFKRDWGNDRERRYEQQTSGNLEERVAPEEGAEQHAQLLCGQTQCSLQFGACDRQRDAIEVVDHYAASDKTANSPAKTRQGFGWRLHALISWESRCGSRCLRDL